MRSSLPDLSIEKLGLKLKLMRNVENGLDLPDLSIEKLGLKLAKTV